MPRVSERAGGGPTGPISEKKLSVGSDESSRRLLKREVSGRLEEYEVEAIKAKLDRCAFAELDVSKVSPSGDGFEALACEPLGQAGLQLTAKNGGVVAPSTGPDWSFTRSLKPIITDLLPHGSSVIVHPGNQRVYARNTFPAGSEYAAYLDLTMSELRDRFILHNAMEILLLDVSSNRYHKLNFGVPLIGNSHPLLSWHMRINRDHFWSLRTKPHQAVVVSYNSSSGHSSSTMSTTASTALSSEASKFSSVGEATTGSRGGGTKSVSWGNVDVEDGSKSTLKAPEDEEELITSDEDEDNVKSTTQYIASFPKDASAWFDGQEIMRLAADDYFKLKCAVIAKKGAQGIPTNMAVPSHKQQEFIPIFGEHISDPNFAAIIAMEPNATQLLLPRVHTRSDSTRVLLKLPSDVVFPLLPGDVLTVRNATHDVLRMRLRIPKLSRAVPSAEAEARGEELNAAHMIKDFGLELNYHGGPTSNSPAASAGWGVFSPMLKDPPPEKAVLAKPKAYYFPKRFFSSPSKLIHIGRAEGEITVLDQYLSRHHAVIKRAGSRLFTLEPTDAKKAIYMLCGKSDMHSRPPVALRVGDTITCGKCEFTVVFQQRGNRELAGSAGKTGLEELLARLEAGRSVELRVRGGGDAPASLSATAAPAIHRPPQEDEIKFEKLNLNASEAFRRKSVSAQTEAAEVPLFQDQRSLVDHFEAQKDLQAQGPLMVLLATKGPRAKQFYSCSAVETTIGSSPWATVSVTNDKRMSPYHCRVYFDKDAKRWMLEDLQSHHGTFLKVTEPTLLSTGDVFVMGTTLMRVLGQQSQPQAGRCITN